MAKVEFYKGESLDILFNAYDNEIPVKPLDLSEYEKCVIVYTPHSLKLYPSVTDVGVSSFKIHLSSDQTLQMNAGDFVVVVQLKKGGEVKIGKSIPCHLLETFTNCAERSSLLNKGALSVERLIASSDITFDMLFAASNVSIAGSDAEEAISHIIENHDLLPYNMRKASYGHFGVDNRASSSLYKSAALFGTEDFTIEFWGSLSLDEDVPFEHGAVIGHLLYGTPYYGGIGFGTSNAKDFRFAANFKKNGDSANYHSEFLIAKDVVQYVVVCKKQDGLRYYVNGVLQKDHSLNLSGAVPNDNILRINTPFTDTHRGYDLKLGMYRCSVGIALSEDEILKRFNGGNPGRYVLSGEERRFLRIEFMPECFQEGGVVNTVDKELVACVSSPMAFTNLVALDLEDMVSHNDLAAHNKVMAATFAKKSEAVSHEELANFDYQAVDLNPYMKEIDAESRYLKKADAEQGYIPLSDKPALATKDDLSGLATKGDLSDVVRVTDLSGYQTVGGMDAYVTNGQMDAALDELRVRPISADQIPSSSISESMLSAELVQTILSSGGGSIVNHPDGEQLTTMDNRMVLAEKAGGVQSSLLFASRHTIEDIFGVENAIVVFEKVVILDDRVYDIAGRGVTWVFLGGMIQGGVLRFGNSVHIVGSGQLFSGIELTDDSENICGVLRGEWFGVKGDGVSDDTAAIHKVVSLVRNPDFLPNKPVPFYRSFKKTRLILDSVNGYRVSDTIVIGSNRSGGGMISLDLMISELIWAGGDKTCLYLDSFYDSDIEVNLSSVSDRDEEDWVVDWNLANKTAVVMRNFNRNNVQIYKVSGFTRGIVCLADGYGFWQNKIYLMDIFCCLEGFIVRSENKGWPNENWVYGGAFGMSTNRAYYAGVKKRRSHIKVENDGALQSDPNEVYGTNSWVFYDQAFEGRLIVNGMETVILDSATDSTRGVREWQFVNTRIEHVNPTGPVFLLGKNTYKFSFSSYQAVDNLGAVMEDGSLPTRLQYISDQTVDDFIELYGLNYVDMEYSKRMVRGRGTVLKNSIASVYGVLGKHSCYGTGGYSYGLLLSLPVGCEFVVRGRKRLQLFLLDGDLNYIAKDDFLVLDGNLYLAELPSPYIAYYTSTVDAAVQDVRISVGAGTGVRYLFVASTGEELKVLTTYGSEKPVLDYFYNQRRLSLSDCFYVDHDLDVLNVTCEKGERFYNVSNDRLYCITKSGTYGSVGVCVFSEAMGASVLSPVSGSVQNLSVGEYCRLNSNVFRIVEVNTQRNWIRIDRALSFVVQNTQIEYVLPEYEIN